MPGDTGAPVPEESAPERRRAPRRSRRRSGAHQASRSTGDPADHGNAAESVTESAATADRPGTRSAASRRTPQEQPAPAAPQDRRPGDAPASAGTVRPDTADHGTGAPADRTTAATAAAATTSAAAAAPAAASTPAAPASTGSFSGRRGRRHWAAAHGFEYTREDPFLTAEWPVSLIRGISPSDAGPAARDLVSGFVDGHQLHIADVAGSTLFALRRGAYSPVDVHATTVAAMPAGMRHDADLDRAPFTVYTTDPRATGRMTDSRVEAALAGLSGSVSDIAFSGAWVVARCPRKTDADAWDALLPHLVALGTASRVLPPLVTSATLDIAVADPTRPRPASGARIRPATGGAHAAAEDAGAGAASGRSTRPGHLRAVPDAPEPAEQETPAGQEDTASTGSAATSSTTAGHPTVERSADPVEFPTRSQGRVLGDADLDGAWPEDVAEDGLTNIPALGEEPSPHPGPGPGDPRIMRTGGSATIFADGPGMGAGIGDPEPRKSRRKPLRGRHRGPDARHAGADDHAGDDYDVVDPEVVDPED